jgi:formate hydrogenlyase transcriptional activator
MSAVSPFPNASWATKNGLPELELLLRATVFHSAGAVLIVDNESRCRDASVGAAKLLRMSRHEIAGRGIEEFVEPGSRTEIAALWQTLPAEGEQHGTWRLLSPDGSRGQVQYSAKANVLPLRHVLILQPDATSASIAGEEEIPSCVQDYALSLLDADGNIAAWYSGAERVYSYSDSEATGQHVSFLYPGESTLDLRLEQELNRVADEGHCASEGWQMKRDGSRFWASVITKAVKHDNGRLLGFAREVRDFSDRHQRDPDLRSRGSRVKGGPTQSSVAGVASGEFDRIVEANEAFLALVGYSREDLAGGRIHWPDLTPAEFCVADELAHEECLRFGACTPFEKELIAKDGIRVPILMVMALTRLSPLRWIAFTQDLRDRYGSQVIEREQTAAKHNFEGIVGTSPALGRVLRQVDMVAPTDATVLILGETGTGKELIARAVHKRSPRKDRPFVTLNCAAIPTGLLESELFGYERGAFTGALSQKVGRFELANGGTLFLDEVGDIPLELQPKLLRALQEKSFERLGGTRTIPIDVRLVAATNRNLTQMMGDKLFRSDLYYRLKVFPVVLPPLRDRPEDIPMLVRHFTHTYSEKMNRHIDSIAAETMQALIAWSWPGNVRELENFIERSVILSPGGQLRAPLSEIRPAESSPAGSGTLEHVEREHLVRVLRETNGVVSKAAVRLGIPRTTLNAMMRKLGISRKDL